MPNPPHVAATVAEQLRVVDGFARDERPDIVERLSSLDAHLAGLPAADTDLQLSIKDRGRPGQKTTLECWIAGHNRLIASSSQEPLSTALAEVRDDLRRQLDEVKSRREPGHNGHHAADQI